MNRAQQIPIGNIVHGRDWDPADDLTALKNNIAANGQKQHILVDDNMMLIDGLRRLMAMELLGYDEVSVIVSDNLEDTCAMLSRVRLHGLSYAKGTTAKPLTPLRIWELFTGTHDQMKDRGTELRKRRIGVPRSTPIEHSVRSRAMFCEALGFSSESTLAATALLYKAFTTNTDPKRSAGLAEIRRKLESDELSLYEARGALDKLGKTGMDGDIVSVDAQRSALAISLSGLSGVTKGLTRIGEPSPELTQVELQMYLRSFEQGRRDLQRFINTFRKRASQ